MLYPAVGESSGGDEFEDRADESEENAEHEAAQDATVVQLPAEVTANLITIGGLCRRSDADRSELARRLLASGLSPEYLAQLQEIAEAGADASERIIAGLAKSEKAKKRLIEANLRLAIWVARRYGGLSLVDRIQEGNIGLMRAADRFDLRRVVDKAEHHARSS